jgi:beta-phosphoglucomutase
MFDWIKKFDLFLLDFDGLLVNTEKLHFEAYKKMVESLGFSFPIDFHTYLSGAHISQEELKNLIYSHCSGLKEKYPEWLKIREIKQKIYGDLLFQGQLELMPGVKELLDQLTLHNKKSCIVTNSPKDQIYLTESFLPQLKQIPYRITREDYTHPKPSGECYRLAIQKYGNLNDRIVGFEDSQKGVMALKDAGVLAIEVNPYAKNSLADHQFLSFFAINFA